MVHTRLMTREAATVEATAHSGLLSLPAEIRNRIYELVIETDGVLEIYAGRCRHHSRIDQPALSLTCRQIRAETLPIYYGRSAFRFDIAESSAWDYEDCPLMHQASRMTEIDLMICNHETTFQLHSKGTVSSLKLGIYQRTAWSMSDDMDEEVQCFASDSERTLNIGQRLLDEYKASKRKNTKMSGKLLLEIMELLDSATWYDPLGRW